MQDIRKNFKYTIEDNGNYYLIDTAGTDPEILDKNIYKFIAAIQTGLNLVNKPYEIITNRFIKLIK